MLTLEQALQHGAAVGVKYYVKNSYDKIVGGTCTEEQALSMKKRFEEEEYRDNIPENFQSGERYEHIEEICESLSDAVSSLEDATSSIEEAIE